VAVIADLHCHYAMHLLEREDRPRLRHLLRRAPVKDRLRALVMWLANRIANYRKFSDGPRVTLDALERGGVSLVLSVLYVPFDEVDLGQRYGAPPRSRYADDLDRQLARVEEDLAREDPAGARHTIVRTSADLAAARGVAFVHCVEGGFHVGATPQEIDANVARLAERGVVYITVAHLFFRQVAANAPALPFLSDRWYDRIFPQPGSGGLTAMGEAVIRAMVREKVLVDLSHMRADALTETLDLLDEIAPEVPVIASHAGARFADSTQHYQLADETIERIGRRGGVVGLIMAQHQLNDGIRRTPTTTLPETVDVMRRHIDRISGIAGPGHVGLGTDLDGFIKPTMGGIESAADLGGLRDQLLAHYPQAEVDAVLYGNARRVVEQVLGAR
jgi:microsomal dipeptidase-like Zn-dependent dipeptidase